MAEENKELQIDESLLTEGQKAELQKQGAPKGLLIFMIVVAVLIVIGAIVILALGGGE